MSRPLDTLPDVGFFETHRDKIEFGAPSGCWLWNAPIGRNRYAQIRARGKKRKVHREAYEAANGVNSASGLVVRHKCDTPLCVNPDHLETGTHADNMRDMADRGRNRQPKGEASGRAKLTEDNVREIRDAYVRGSPSHGQDSLAQAFDVSRVLIGKIVRRKIWRHV